MMPLEIPKKSEVNNTTLTYLFQGLMMTYRPEYRLKLVVQPLML